MPQYLNIEPKSEARWRILPRREAIVTGDSDRLSGGFEDTVGIPFLGFLTRPERRRLRRRKGLHFVRGLRRLLALQHEGAIGVERIGESVLGWVNHVRCATTVGLRKSVLRRVVVRPSRHARRGR
jgi:hypothetical protein